MFTWGKAFRLILACIGMGVAAIGPAGGKEPLALYTEEWPPVSFLRNGKADGMAVEIVSALQKRVGDNARIEIVPWARGYSYLIARPNVMLFTVARSPEREKFMTLIGPVAVSHTELFCRKGEAARYLRMGDVIKRMPVTAYRGSIFKVAAEAKGFVNIIETVDSGQSARLLMAGRVGLWVEGGFAAGTALAQAGFSADSVDRVTTLESLQLYLAFSMGTPRDTVLAWENALRAMKKDGSFQSIYRRWLPQETPPPDVVRVGLEP
ncbi:substrate-binding periplasmic protein [Paludibacterium paludis]|uniref:Amino acid ABC transporter substrate-binding protein n=1 Tax=Paludibacterium paludis TaxID=1225769 RepID=A0A918P205_9NEIS|nr:ABC transporter substrate-binding protein [Paludibacterium paludis]GGY13463.1 amino acid ABC transporter substrate-binding protein [Paludibacterium paludis]